MGNVKFSVVEIAITASYVLEVLALPDVSLLRDFRFSVFWISPNLIPPKPPILILTALASQP